MNTHTAVPIVNFSGRTSGVMAYMCEQISRVLPPVARVSVAENAINSISALRSNAFGFYNWQNAMRSAAYVMDAITNACRAKTRRAADRPRILLKAFEGQIDRAANENVRRIATDRLRTVESLAIIIIACANIMPQGRLGTSVYGNLLEDAMRPEHVTLREAIDAIEIAINWNQKLFEKEFVSGAETFLYDAISSRIPPFHQDRSDEVHEAAVLAHDALHFYLANPYPDFIDRVNSNWKDLYECGLIDKRLSASPRQGAISTILAPAYDRISLGHNVFYSPHSAVYEAAARENLGRFANKIK